MRRAILIWAMITLTASAAAQDQAPLEPQGCSDCHAGPSAGATNGEAPDDKLLAPDKLISQSVHSGLDCTDCHSSLSMDDIDLSADRPHGETVEPVHCGECHSAADETYRMHGRMEVGKDRDIPKCWSCHGSHDVLPTADLHSRVHPINLPDTCKSCHTDMNLVKRHEYLRDEPIKLYESSVHGQASKGGRYLSATCNDCHSAPDPDGKRTAHRILSGGDPRSTIYHFNVPNTCGQCHERVTLDYWDGIHGKLVKRGQVDSPVCTHCHGEHGIIRAKDARSPVSAARVAEATCAPCHESEVLNEKYGIPAGRLRSYVDSYHGLKSKAGDVEVANCASCHGAHRILPHTDAASSINPANLQATCGKCHPGISEQLAHTPIHETATGIRAGWPNFFRVFYLSLISITIGLMLLHCIADLVRHIKIMRRRPYVVRMTPNETIQHWLLTISFIALVVSGFSLRFSEAWWVQLLFGWGDGEGFTIRGTVHRAAAVLFAFCCLWHLFYLFSQRGRRALRDMILAKRDFGDISHNAAYFLGLRSEKPRFGRFSYMEKAEYWALVWGGVIMSLTGFVLWFDNYFVDRWGLPKGVLDVMLVIHYYEAWLATLAILVWHGYSVIFSPHVFPMNPAWMGGKMPKEMYVHEHPEGPRLKAQVYISQIADEEAAEADVD